MGIGEHCLEIDFPPSLVRELKQESKAKGLSQTTLCRQALEAHANGNWPSKSTRALVTPETEVFYVFLKPKEGAYLASISVAESPARVMAIVIARWLGCDLLLEDVLPKESLYLVPKLPTHMWKWVDDFCVAEEISASTLFHRIIQAHAAGEKPGGTHVRWGRPDKTRSEEARLQDLKPLSVFVEKTDQEYLDAIGAVADFGRETVMTLLILYWFNVPFLSHADGGIPEPTPSNLRMQLPPYIWDWVAEDCYLFEVFYAHSIFNAAVSVARHIDRTRRGKCAPRPEMPKSLPPRERRHVSRTMRHLRLDSKNMAFLHAVASVTGLEPSVVIVITLFKWFEIPLLAPLPATQRVSQELN